MFKQTLPKREPARSALRKITDRVLFAVYRLWAAARGVFFYTRVRTGVVLAIVVLVLPVMVATGLVGRPGDAVAATANTLNFQARLQSSAGAIAPDGSYNIQFKLYNVATGGSALWTETYSVSGGNGVQTRNGYLSVPLGSISSFPTSIDWGQQLYLTMNIGGTGSSASWDGEMNPRLSLTSVPSAYSLTSYNSDTGYTGSLKVAQMTNGNQVFTVADQGAAGTYTLLTTQAANSSFIQNQNSSPQTANFYINGTGVVASGLQGPSFDTNGSGSLELGTTNATAVTIGSSGIATSVAGSLGVSGGLTVSAASGVSLTVSGSGDGDLMHVTGSNGAFSIDQYGNVSQGGSTSLNGVELRSDHLYTGGSFILRSASSLDLESQGSSGVYLRNLDSGNIYVGNAGTGNTYIGNGDGAVSVNANTDITGSLQVTSAINGGTALQVMANGLTTGTGLEVSTTSNSLTSGNLMSVTQNSTYTSAFTSENKLLNVSRQISGPPAPGSVVFDNRGKAVAANTQSLTWSHTVGSGSNRLLIVDVASQSDTAVSVSYTVGGTTVPLTKISEQNVTSNNIHSQWRLIAPIVGTGTVTVSRSNNGNLAGVSSSWFGVNQTTPIGTSVLSGNVPSGDGAVSVSVPTALGQTVVDSVMLSWNGGQWPTLTQGSNQTLVNKNLGTDYVGLGSSYKTATSTSTTMSWSWSDSLGGAYGYLVATPLNGAISYGLTDGVITGSVANIASSCAGCNESSSVLNIQQANTMATGAVLSLQNAGLGADIEFSSGILRNTTDSTAAISIQNAGGTATLFKADTTNNRIVIGDGTGATPTSLVLDTGASDPDGTNGAMYYNTVSNVFRCYASNTWINCAESGSSGVSIAQGSGTSGKLVKFGTGSVLADSGLSESATTLTYDGNAIINAGPSFSGNLLDLQVDGVSKFAVDQSGAITSSNLTSSGALSLQSSGANTVSIDSGTTGAVSLGTGSYAKSVTVGSTTGTSALTLQSGTGGIALTGDTSIAGTLNVSGSLSTGGTVRLTSDGTLQNVKIGSSVSILSTDSAGNVVNLTADDNIGKCVGYNGTEIAWIDCGNSDSNGATIANGSGVSGRITKFNASGELADSALSESGSTLSYAGNLTANAAAGFTGNLVDLKLDGTSQFAVNQAGAITAASLTASGSSLTLSGGTSAALDIQASGTITIGTGGAFNKNVTIGNTTGTSALALQSGSGGIGLTGNSTITGTLNVSSDLSTGGTTRISGTGTLSNVTLQTGSSVKVGSANAFGVLYADSSNVLQFAGVSAVNSYTKCLLTNGVDAIGFGNCPSGSGGVAIASGSGNSGKLIKFSPSGELADSGLSESSSVLTYAGSQIINAASGFTGNLMDLRVNGTSKFSVNEAGALTTSGAINGLTLAAGGITSSGGLTLQSTTTSAVSLDSGTTGNVSVGTGANSKTVTIGNTTGTSSLILQGGSNGISLTGNSTITGTLNVSSSLSTGGAVRINNAGTLSNVKLGAAQSVVITDTSGNLTNLSVSGASGKCLGYSGSSFTWSNCSSASGGSGWSLTGTDAAGSILGVNTATSANFVISSRPNNVGATSSNASYISFSGDQFSNANRIVISGNSNFNSAQGGGSWSSGNNKDYFRIQDSNGNVAFAVQGSSSQQQVFMYLAAGSSVGVQGRVCSTLLAGGSGMATIATCTNTGTDLAEAYRSTQQLEAGEIVAVDHEHYPNVVRSSTAGQGDIIGIVSTEPNETMGTQTITDGYPIALNGRVPTKVNGEGGAIQPGDKITSSSVPGVGKKANGAGMIVGVALTGYDGIGDGVIQVFVSPGYYEPTSTDTLQAQTGVFGDLNVSGTATINNLVVTGLATVHDLQINGHFVTAGNAPQIQLLTNTGVNATATVTGNDIGGTVTLQTGVQGVEPEDAILAPGAALTITFNTPYAAVPRVMITADDGQSAQMEVFPAQRTVNGFTLSLNKLPAANTTYTFTYFVTQ